MARQIKEFNLEKFDAKNFKSMYIEASAGTGKTYTIENLVKKMVESGQPLEKILIVTFTEKAVGELRHRIREKLGKINKQADVDNAPIFTIHSFCQRTLEEFAFTARQPYSLKLIDESEIASFIDKWIRDDLKDNDTFKELYEAADKGNLFVDKLKKDFAQAIGKYYLDFNGAENQSIVSLDDVGDKKAKKAEDVKKACFYKNILASLYLAWQQKKALNKSQTFNDMIRNVREAVCQENSELAIKLRQKYSIAIIDEFQDTNKKQWDIFKTIFMEGSDQEKSVHKIIVVGDPKQSIFAFQGADVNVYASAVQEISQSGGDAFSLLTNYRSSTTMIEACNRLFSNKAGADGGDGIKFFSSQEFFDSKAPQKQDKQTLPAAFNGSETKPFWIFGSSENPVDSEAFAEFAVKKIIECCSYDGDGKTKLLVYNKSGGKNGKTPAMRNVSFRDFAVLARTSSEMEDMEAALKNYGVPFYRYKDKNLFYGLECASWISVINAICASDFNGGNRKFLSEALWTKFFGVALDKIGDERFDNPANEARQKILVWRQIAEKRQWAKLIESIFEESQIENALSDSQSIQSVSKFRQIGNYIADYLYSNDCSLEEAAKHLARLSQASEFSEDDGNLVAKGTNFDCVQIMTIHASKGLEFPIVIAACGFKGRYNQIPAAYLYHDQEDNGRAKLGFSDFAKKKMQAEEDEEIRRLFYVAYTRASSLMMIPFYEKWTSSYAKFLNFLNKNFAVFMENSANKNFYESFEFKPESKKNLAEIQSECKELVKGILTKSAQSKKDDDAGCGAQTEEAKQLAKKIPALGVEKHSYTSLSNKNKQAMVEENFERLDKEQSAKTNFSLAEFDQNAAPVLSRENLFENFTPPVVVCDNYPRGSFLGSAVHEVFEKIDFAKAAKLDLQTFAADRFASALIDRCFARHGLEIDLEDNLKWREQTARFVWNVLNARLPEICGSSQTGGAFSLKEICLQDRSAEARFDMVSELFADKKRVLQNYCNGAIDLIFKRQVGGKDVYSIVDWKSNFVNLDTARAEAFEGDLFKDITDKEYSVQRVLYSYCLILWLKEFYGVDEETIFNERFGGVYYVYLRYCEPESSKGIYAQTWKSWSDLKAAFKNICEKLIAQGN